MTLLRVQEVTEEAAMERPAAGLAQLARIDRLKDGIINFDSSV